MNPPPASNTLIQYGVRAGLVGLVATLFAGAWVSQTNPLYPQNKSFDSLGLELAVVAMVGACMLLVTLLTRVQIEGRSMIALSPEIKNRTCFVFSCIWIFCCNQGLLLAAAIFYRLAPEYGYRGGNPTYYAPWFKLLEVLITVHTWAGFPYVLITRALQHDPVGDRKEAGVWYWRKVETLLPSARRLGFFEGIKPDGQLILLSAGVKVFFLPLMTVFFHDQFPHLVKNWRYILDGLEGASQEFGWKDFYNIGHSLIYTVDVSLAWVGYAVTSRWVRNHNVSVEPTIIGWAVALLCYPPIRQVFGWYFQTPAESLFLSMGSSWIIGFFAVLNIGAGLVYMFATVYFGVHFSNLTHRGIITRGPFSWVRHPAYAAKNLSWWLAMLPYALYLGITGDPRKALSFVIGLLALSALYYWRALTEERHLLTDAVYINYCNQVPDRFFPLRFFHRRDHA